MKRYAVTITMYMWDKGEHEVIEQAKKVAEKLRENDVDNRADVESIYETPFGVFESKYVDLKQGEK